VFSRPEYAEAEPSLFRRALDWIFDQFGDPFAEAEQFEPSETAGMITLVLLGIVAAWLLLRALRRVSRDRRAPVEIGEPTGRSEQDWLTEAATHEAQGDFGAALRCHYRATVAWLAADGFLDEVPGATTGEYRAALAEALPQADEPFSELTTAFERAWYGRARVDRGSLDRAAAAAQRVRRFVPVESSA
jgi:hypothetical protein